MSRWVRYFMAVVAVCGMANSATAENIKVYTGIAMGSFFTDYGSSAAGNIKGKAVFGSYLTISSDINRYLSFEIRYGKAGKATLERNGATWAGQSVSLDSFSSILLRPQYPFGRNGHIYAMVGTSSMNLAYSNGGIKTTTTKSGISYGAGFKVHLADTWAIGSEFTQYTSKQNFSQGHARTSGFTATVNYMFD
ncbi:MAG: porin family protein [Mariprofundaceae bacterium]|nr:porin family protein [Mariprofundaceae bacterium]